MIEWGVLGLASGDRGTIKPMDSESAARWAAHQGPYGAVVRREGFGPWVYDTLTTVSRQNWPDNVYPYFFGRVVFK